MAGTRTISLTDLPLSNRRAGKVREVCDATHADGTPATLLVASDRLSAYDVVMPTPVPGKGRVLTQLSAFWFRLIGERMKDVLPTHLLSTALDDVQELRRTDTVDAATADALRGRVMLGRRCQVIPIECVARGYVAGSAWSAYQRDGAICGVPLPAGLKQCERLPEPIFTPATKAAQGHDENIPFDRAAEIVGGPLMETLRSHTLSLYRFAHAYAAGRGLLLADTKFEFGLPVDDAGQVVPDAAPILIDEALTPDSSRYWPADTYAPGRDQDSFDKQYVRDYLQGLVDEGRWDKQSPGPELPETVVEQTLGKYVQAYQRLTGAAPELG